MDTRLAVVIMAAGKGTRMNNPAMAKVLYTINERPMIDWVIDVAERLDAARTVAIVGWVTGGLWLGVVWVGWWWVAGLFDSTVLVCEPLLVHLPTK